MTTMPTREERLTHLLDKLTDEARAAGTADTNHDTDTARHHEDEARNARNAIILQARILGRKAGRP